MPVGGCLDAPVDKMQMLSLPVQPQPPRSLFLEVASMLTQVHTHVYACTCMLTQGARLSSQIRRRRRRRSNESLWIVLEVLSAFLDLP